MGRVGAVPVRGSPTRARPRRFPVPFALCRGGTILSAPRVHPPSAGRFRATPDSFRPETSRPFHYTAHNSRAAKKICTLRNFLDNAEPLEHNTFMNKLTTAKRAAVVAALVEGNSIRSTVRMTGASKPTILKLLADLGTICAAYQDEMIRNVKAARPDKHHVQESAEG